MEDPALLRDVYQKLEGGDIPTSWKVHYNYYKEKKKLLNPTDCSYKKLVQH